MENVELAKSEQYAKARPVLKADALKMDDYDTVILGYPKLVGRYADDRLQFFGKL